MSAHADLAAARRTPEDRGPLWRSERLWHAVGVFALCWFGYFAALDAAHANQGLLLMAMVAVLRFHRELRALARESMVWLTGVFLVYLVARTWVAMAEFPAYADPIVDAANDWAKIGFLALVVTAYWLARSRIGAVGLLALLLAGFLTRILGRLDWSDLGGQIGGFIEGPTRATFGYSSVNLGIWSLIALLGLIAMWRRFLVGQGGVWRRAAFAALWASALLICGSALVFSQARSAWLTALLVVPPMLLVTLYRATGSTRRFLALGTLALALGGVALSQVADVGLIRQRIAAEHETIERLVAGEVTDLPSDSIGLRLAMYRAFWKVWRKRPWFGWAPGGMQRALDDSGVNYLTEERFRHFHSLYLDVLFQFGIVGGLLVAAMFGLILRGAWRALRDGTLAPDVGRFVIAALAAFLIAGLVNEPLLSANGGYLVTVLGALALHGDYRARLRAAGHPGLSRA